jgi:AraC-like DNA-binding protein
MPLRQVTRPEPRAARIVALIVGRSERARLEEGLRKHGYVHFASTVAELRQLLQSRGATPALIVAEPRDAADAPTAPLIRQIRCEYPTVPLVGYCRADGDYSREILDLANAGVHELVFRNASDNGVSLHAVVDSAVRACGGAFLVDRLRPQVPTEIMPLVEFCLYFPREATGVEPVATALGVHRKTLTNHCTRAGFPAAGTVISWCRLLVACHLMRAQSGSVERVAYVLEFASATALRNMLRRYSGLRPTEVRAPDGFERLLAAFTYAMSSARPVKYG